MCFPGTSGLSAHPDLKYSWEWGQPQGTQAVTAPYCSHATRWSWGWQFREHWTMTGPLPHPAEPEFALLSNSAGFRAKLIPRLPLFLLLSGLCWVLAAQGRAELRPSYRAWPITPASCLWIIPEAEQEPGEGGSQACPAPSWSTGWGAPGTLLSPRQDLSPLSRGVCVGPAAIPQQSRARTAAAGQRSCPSLPPPHGDPCPGPPRPLPVPGSFGKSSAVLPKAKSRLRGAGSHGRALRGAGSRAAGEAEPAGLASAPGTIGSTLGPWRGCSPAARGIRRGGDRGR